MPRVCQRSWPAGPFRERAGVCGGCGEANIDIRGAVRTIPGMGEHELRHLAFIACTTPESDGLLDRTVVESCGRASQLAREAFALVPGLRAFSWLSPGIDLLLSRAAAPNAARACAAGARALAATADGLGVSLRLCGPADGLPSAAFAHPVRAEWPRTLLWFQRYSGKDEIVRAAGRYFAAHPGKELADGELDAWLDTAGVPDPDLLVYAGGALEPHDALLWQGSYAEIWHTPDPWQSFSGTDLRRAVDDYFERQRRFGR